MGGHERRIVRKPATKFGHLQKKLGKQRAGVGTGTGTGTGTVPKRPKSSGR